MQTPEGMCPCGCGSDDTRNWLDNHSRFLELVEFKEWITDDIWHMHAKYNTVCSICSEKIPVGCQIIRVPDEVDTEYQEYKFVWIHMKCFIPALQRHYACLDGKVQQALVDHQHADEDGWFAEYGEGTHGFSTSGNLKEDLEEQENLRHGNRDTGTEFLYNVAYHWINPHGINLPIGEWAAMEQIAAIHGGMDHRGMDY